MRVPILLASVALLTAAACESATLSGAWGWAYNGNPGGAFSVLYVGVAGNSVEGTAITRGAGPQASNDTLSISGVYWATSFHLTLTDRQGLLSTYVGALVSHNELRGTWTDARNTAGVTVIFYRE